MTARVTALAALTALAAAVAAQAPPAAPPRFPGPTDTGFLLPNGWHLTPAGKHLVTSDLVLNIRPLKDGKRVLVASNGFNSHDLTLVDVSGDAPKLMAKQTAWVSWFGLTTDAAETKVYWSGGSAGRVYSFGLTADALTPDEPLPTRPAKKDREAKKEEAKKEGKAARVPKAEREVPACKSGVLLDEAGGRLFTLDINNGGITATDQAGKNGRTGLIGGKPYDLCFGPSKGVLYVSDWAGKQVLEVDPTDLRVLRKIGVGEHPNQMAVGPDGRLFVACASSNTVSVLDTNRGVVTETIFTALFPNAPEGSTPDALAVSPDGKALYVANADNNCVAVIDVSVPGKSQVKGFVPTGWYPTAVAVSPDSKTLYVGVGKGLQSKANPIDDDKKREGTDYQPRIFPYIGTTMSGAMSVVPVPTDKQLKEYTEQVYKNCPYSDKLLTAAPHPEKTAVPTAVGGPSPIKRVIYVIKENRTYDQVFGDLAAGDKPKGNGDPTLCMFPRKVTPNHHKLAEEFVLLDNLYCNGQVSTDGHPWSTMAYNTDYIARNWHVSYSGRPGLTDDAEGNLARGPSGHLWDACKRAGLTYRNYGEGGRRVSQMDGTLTVEGASPSLVGHMCPTYGVPKVPGTRARDTDNAVTFLKEYDEFAAKGTMPRMIIMSLGEDHTDGTRTGSFTPQACVASNDLALGRIVEHVSKGQLWKETAIFVIEDDAQNGPDHVDAHRTVGLVISPYTKRKVVDSTQYATVSMIRTMELILGLPPLSQYDAAARPMFNSFTNVADLTPYTHTPAEIDLNAKNGATAYGAARSNKMDFSEYDKIDDFELNEVLWGAIMGPDAPQPPAVRRAIPFRAIRD